MSAGLSSGAFGAPINDQKVGLRVEERTGLGIAVVMAHKDVDPSRLQGALGVQPVAGAKRVAGNGIAVMGTGPDVWLTIKDNAPGNWVQELAKELKGVASVADQSGGYAVLRISGTSARHLMSAGAYIDFDPRSFKAGSVATATVAHIGIVIWQSDDAPTYEVALFRSFVPSFRHWIETSLDALHVSAPKLRFSS